MADSLHGVLRAGRAWRERAGCRQSPDGRGIDVVGSGQVGVGLTSGKTLQGFLALVRCHLVRPPEKHAAFLGTLASLACTSRDQRTLELGKPPRTVTISLP